MPLRISGIGAEEYALPEQELVVAVVGAGPGGVGVLERLVANAGLLPGVPVEVVLVDPHPPGGGRIWRHRQSPLFTDESVRMDGPVCPGPALDEWAGIDPGTFATRQVHSGYLDWFYRRTVAAAPASWTVRAVPARVRDLADGPDGRQLLALDGGGNLRADLVVLALGHLDARPHGEHRELAAYARRHGLFYLPPAYSADVDLDGIPPGRDVLMRGLGLAFVDLVVLLTEGRGGRYETRADGTLAYLPSGREPVIHAGSRRGVPYHSKLDYRVGSLPPLPRFFGPEQVDALLAAPGPLDFRADVWPLVAKEIGYGYYHQLSTAHPQRLRVDPADFRTAYARLPAGDVDGLAKLVERAVPDPADRLDLARLDRPLSGVRFRDAEHLQEHLRGYLRADRDRAADPAYSADQGAFYALLSVYGQLPRLLAANAIHPASRLGEVELWWHGYFSYLASGPPGFRLEELLALSRAGLVRFVGPDMWVSASGGRFHAGSPAVPGEVVADALVESRLPQSTIRHTADDLLRRLAAEGAVVEEVLVDPRDGSRHPSGRILVDEQRRLVTTAGPHPRRYAIGFPTSRRAAAAFARPGTNAIAFRQNDALARTLLGRLAALAPPDRRTA
jgi:FAD-NAD(P)-binding protein